MAYRASREKAKSEKEGISMIQNTDFWPRHIGASPVLPHDPLGEARIEARRRLLAKQASLLASLAAAPTPEPGLPFLAYKSGGVWRRVVA